jgi:hypothetical protein
MKHHSDALSIYKTFSAMICTHFDTPIRVFRADSAGEYLSDALHQVLAEQGTLAQFSCPGAHAQNGVAERKHRHLLETAHTLMIVSSVPPHFWAEAISTVNYLINIQPSSTLQGGIPFERLYDKTHDYSSLHLFGCVSYVLLAPRERTKLTAQSVECIFLGYIVEHKGYRCWDSAAHRMQTSWDVIFDESRPFYPRPTTDAPPASLPLPRPTLPTSVSSAESSPVVPDYTVKPPVTQVYNRRGARLSDAPTSSAELSSDVSSSSLDVPSFPPVLSSSPIGSSPEQLLGCAQHIHRPPNCYYPSAYTATALSEPTSYRDTILHSEWQHAMAEEIVALERTSMWDLVSCLSCVCPITCKWIYKVKTRSDGSLERYKTRIVARGFQQEHDRDYDETFALVAHMTTIHTLLVVASVQGWSISQFDVKNVFLNGELREDVYMHPPPEYYIHEGMVCHLHRSLYGLKQTPQAWFQRFASVVTAAGFFASAHDLALFVHVSSHGRTLLLFYVDDMIITGDGSEYITFIKAHLSDQFLMSDLGPLRYFLEIEISSTPEGFFLSQEKHIQDLLDRASLTDHQTAETPMELNVHLVATDGEPLEDPTHYHHIVGSLVYLGVIRLDILYSVHILSQFVSASTQIHYSHILHVMHYLRGTISRRLFFPRSSSLQLHAYCDATWSSDPSDHHSLFAYCIFLGGFLIAWMTKKQVAVSRSSAKTELRAMTLVTVGVTWLRWLLEDFGVSISMPTPLLSDITWVIIITRDLVKHELTKHVGVDAHFTRSNIQDVVVAL